MKKVFGNGKEFGKRRDESEGFEDKDRGRRDHDDKKKPKKKKK
jgi:hypothetical protein